MCIAEGQKPVQEQEGAVEGVMCGRWLRSRGGLAVHRCARPEEGGTDLYINLGRSNHRVPGSEITCERDYMGERSIYADRECDCGVQGVWQTTRMRGASMQTENVTVECKECGRLPG